MATTSKVLYRGAPGSAPATLYTVPSATTAVVTNIVVSNPTTSPATFTLSFNGVIIASAVSIDASALTVIDMKQVLTAATSITGNASTSVTFHISGVEIV